MNYLHVNQPEDIHLAMHETATTSQANCESNFISPSSIPAYSGELLQHAADINHDAACTETLQNQFVQVTAQSSIGILATETLQNKGLVSNCSNCVLAYTNASQIPKVMTGLPGMVKVSDSNLVQSVQSLESPLLLMSTPPVQSTATTTGTEAPVTYVLAMTVEDTDTTDLQPSSSTVPNQQTYEPMILLQEPQRTLTPRMKDDDVCTFDETIIAGNLVQVNNMTGAATGNLVAPQVDNSKTAEATENTNKNVLTECKTTQLNNPDNMKDTASEEKQTPEKDTKIPCHQL